jgi:hypothetical protein
VSGVTQVRVVQFWDLFFVACTLTGFISSQIILTIHNKVLYESDYICGMLHVFLINESTRNFCFRTGYLELVYQVLVLCSSCIPVNVGVNQKGYSHKKSLNECKSMG